MDRNYLWFREGDANNAVLAAIGYNFRRLIQWPRILLCQILAALFLENLPSQRESHLLHGRPLADPI